MKSPLDLTHLINSSMPTWSGSCGFHLQGTGDCTKGEFHVQHTEMALGIGTHIDAPSHVISGGDSIDQIPLTQLIAPGVVCDVSQKAHADYLVSLDDIRECGNIRGHLIIIHTGWGRFWNDALKYRNCDENGIMHFPSISPEVAQYLVDNHVVGIAIDTLSPDAPTSEFYVHRLLLKNKIYIIENVANSELLPKKDFEVLVMPMKIEGATEAPIRLVASFS